MPVPSPTLWFGKPKRQPLPPCLHLVTGLDLICVCVGGGQQSRNSGNNWHSRASPLCHCPATLAVDSRTPWSLHSGGDRVAVVVPIWHYYLGMLSCACSLGSFTDDSPRPFSPTKSRVSQLLKRCQVLQLCSVGSWLPQSLGGVCLVVLFRWTWTHRPFSFAPTSDPGLKTFSPP